MLVTLSTWKEYGETASQVRLNRLRFAVSSEGQVLVLGEPLPSVPGNSYYTVKNFLVPAGMEFEFPIAPFMDRIKDLFPPDSMILFDTGSTWTAIPENYFVPARRSSIRQTNTSRLHD
ncbi:MAG: hypothetical protein EOO09_22590 [Chitinophagaceae bacterium]|nr:MAG: hypothetical protein EOO09_22590 [Chitinophagaceae bacterium]